VGATIPLEAATAGDLVRCHSKGVVGRGIRWAEWIRWRRGSEWNHFAWLDHDEAGWIVGQAEARGVTINSALADVAPGGSYEIVPLPAGVDRAKALEFLRAQVGRRYGFVTIASILLTILGPSFLNVMVPDTWICSAVAAEGLRAGGWIHPWGDIYQVTPAQLSDALEPGAPL
jgi:hypothetical protein